MARRTITTNDLANNSVFLIRGKVAFSRITSQVAGEELIKDKQRRMQKGQPSIDRPYTSLSIEHASVVFRNGQNPTSKEEQYAVESLYVSNNEPTNVKFSGLNKGNRLPSVSVSQGNTVTEIVPEGELASGLDVTIVMRVYAPKNGLNNGVTMEGVIVNEPIKYYTSNRMVDNLAAYGLTFAPSAEAAAAQAVTAPVANQGFEQPVAPQQGFQPNAQPMYVPQNGAVNAPVVEEDVFSNQPAYANAVANPYASQPAQASVPAQNPYGAPQGVANPYVANQYAQPQQQQPANPYGDVKSTPDAPGISLGNNRNY